MNEGNLLVGAVIQNKEYQFNLELLGGFQIFLPIYEFLSTPKIIHMNVLAEALTLLHNFLGSGIKNRNNLLDNKTFNFLGCFFAKYDKCLFTEEIKNKFIELVNVAIKNEYEITLIRKVL